jgi:lipoate-protein ligase B
MRESPVPVEIRRHLADDQTPWSYAELELRQRELARAVLAGDHGALLLSEVAPVITRGRRAPITDITLAEDVLERVGISLLDVDRGGLATYHGPGQWVLFPVDRLEVLTGDRRGVRKAVEGLLEVACQVGKLYDPSAEIRSGAEMGVWTRRGKFAAVGVHISQGVLQHGLSVNGLRTTTSFYGLRPCGLDAPVDFLLESSVSDAAVRTDSDLRFEMLGRQLVEATFQNFYR